MTMPKIPVANIETPKAVSVSWKTVVQQNATPPPPPPTHFDPPTLSQTYVDAFAFDFKVSTKASAKAKKPVEDAAPPGTVYACAACGAWSRDRHGVTAPGTWKKCCPYASVLVAEAGMILHEGKVQFARRVRP